MFWSGFINNRFSKKTFYAVSVSVYFLRTIYYIYLINIYNYIVLIGQFVFDITKRKWSPSSGRRVVNTRSTSVNSLFLVCCLLAFFSEGIQEQKQQEVFLPQVVTNWSGFCSVCQCTFLLCCHLLTIKSYEQPKYTSTSYVRILIIRIIFNINILYYLTM